MRDSHPAFFLVGNQMETTQTVETKRVQLSNIAVIMSPNKTTPFTIVVGTFGPGAELELKCETLSVVEERIFDLDYYIRSAEWGERSFQIYCHYEAGGVRRPIGEITVHNRTALLQELQRVFHEERAQTMHYTNHRKNEGVRRIAPYALFWGTHELFHPEPQLLLLAYDLGKEAMRTFAWKDIKFNETPNLPVGVELQANASSVYQVTDQQTDQQA